MKNKLLLGVLAILVIIQFIRQNDNNGEAMGSQDFTHHLQVPENVLSVLKTSCFDCHSNRTEYPWYANVNPVGFWINHHVEEGKGELNFSDFSSYSLKKIDHKLEEIGEEVEGHGMPISSYTLMHKEAELTTEQIKLIVDWAKSERQRLAVSK